MNYYLGIDQGGTKTAAVIIDEKGYIRGKSKTKGAYHIEDGIEAAIAAISAAISLAEKDAGINLSEIKGIGAGVTGMDWPEDYELLRPAIEKLAGISKLQVFNDSIGALYSGTREKYGIVLCAGTGLNVAARNPDGQELVLGFYIDDRDQGGGALARRAIQKVFDSEIGICAPTKLTEAFLDFSGMKNADELLHCYIVDRNFSHSIKHIVPKVISIANEGDPVAKALIEEFASDLSKYIYAGLRKSGMLDIGVDVVLSGSVLKGSDNMLARIVTDLIRSFAPKANIVNSVLEPVIGAGLSALMQDENYDANCEEITKNLNESAVKHGLIR